MALTTHLTGNEHFLYNGVPINRLLLDFWAWQASELLSNTLRGALAEYIVATALDIDTGNSRVNWYEYDLLYGGCRIEVKSSAYLQSWERDGFSRISFSIYPSRPVTATIWDDDDISRHSDIYVFCLFKSKDRETANPMMLEQWDFFVVKTSDIDKHLGSQRSISLLESNRRSNRRSAKRYIRKNTHIFAGLLFCGYCGSQMQSTIDRERADGYRPSIYACSRKRRFDDCENKYISDIVVAPFVLNYIANILKAQNNFGKSTPIETFERKLLRGTMFAEVNHIEQVGLTEMYYMLRRGGLSDTVYNSQRIKSIEADKETADERDLLAAEKRKKERALARLKSLYLYNDEAISERDYLLEKKSLEDAISRIDKRLEEIERSSSQHFSMTDDEFMAKASVFIMTHQLQNKRFIEFEKLIKKIDPQIVKEFVNSVVQKIVIKNGRVVSIRFKNGLEHKFLYKTSE